MSRVLAAFDGAVRCEWLAGGTLLRLRGSVDLYREDLRFPAEDLGLGRRPKAIALDQRVGQSRCIAKQGGVDRCSDRVITISRQYP